MVEGEGCLGGGVGTSNIVCQQRCFAIIIVKHLCFIVYYISYLHARMIILM